MTNPSLLRSTLHTTRRPGQRSQIVGLLCAMAALLGYCGWILAGSDGIFWSIIVGMLLLSAVRRFPIGVFLKGMRARPLLPAEAAGLNAAVTELCLRTGLSYVPRLYRIKEKLPLAFSIGRDRESAIVIADCLITTLPRAEFIGILAHEIAHLHGGDILLQQVGLVLTWLTRLVSQIGFIFVLFRFLMNERSVAEFPLLSLAVLAVAPTGVALLRLALSRARETEADMEAAKLTGDPAALASALEKLRQWQERRLRQLFPIGQPLHLPILFDDHPPTEERIRRLRELAQQPA
jgi:heat shock protein HtpX